MEELTTMSERKRVGYVGAVVADNIQRIREEKNLSRPDLARRIQELQQSEQHGDWELSPSKINALAITRIETGERRVDVDDLVLLAVALEVAVPTLLVPYGEGMFHVQTPAGPTPSGWYWSWLTARRPLTPITGGIRPATPERRRWARQFFLDSIPPWSLDFARIPDESGDLDHVTEGMHLRDSPTYANDDDDPHGGNVQ